MRAPPTSTFEPYNMVRNIDEDLGRRNSATGLIEIEFSSSCSYNIPQGAEEQTKGCRCTSRPAAAMTSSPHTSRALQLKFYLSMNEDAQ